LFCLRQYILGLLAIIIPKKLNTKIYGTAYSYTDHWKPSKYVTRRLGLPWRCNRRGFGWLKGRGGRWSQPLGISSYYDNGCLGNGACRSRRLLRSADQVVFYMLPMLLASIQTSLPDGGNNAILEIAGNFGIKPQLLLAQIVNFIIVALILTFFVIKPIQAKLDERNKLISDGLKRAEESQKTLESAQTQKEEIVAQARSSVQALMERSQKEVQDYSLKKRQEAESEAAVLLEKAKKELEFQQEQQIEKSQRRLAELVVQLAEKSLGEDLTEEQKKRFSERMLESLKK